MEKLLLSKKTISLAELQNPVKAFFEEGGEPAIVLNQDNIIGYLVPKSALDEVRFEYSQDEIVKKTLKASRPEVQSVIDYLRDK